MLPWSDWVVPAALRNRRDGDEGEDFHHFTARSTTRTMLSENTARMGDEGKAVGCVPPTALLFEGGAGIIARCVGRTIFPIPRLAPFVGRWDTRFILAFSGAKHPAIVEASAQRTLRLLALCRGSGRSYCVLVRCDQLLARSRLVLGPCELCWALLDGVSHPSEV